jgi:ribosome maturation factor RimP
LKTNNNANQGKNANSGNTETKARLIAERLSEKYKDRFELWDVLFEKTGALWYLRVYFTPVKGAVLDSDAYNTVTNELNNAFDKEDFIQYVDILEVGSAGGDTILRTPEHFIKCIGQVVCAKIRGEKGKTSEIKGALAEYNNDNITVGTEIIKLKDCLKVLLETQENII